MQMTAGRVGLALGALAAAAGIAWFVMPQAIPVETAAVSKGRFVASVDDDGKTRIRQRYVVAAPIAGRLTRVRLKAGDPVAADEVVAAILPPPAPLLDPRSRREAEERLGTAEAALERSKATVERAQAQADQARTDLDRTRTLASSGASTVQALERAELAQRIADRDLRAAEFQDHAAGHEVAQAKALLGRYSDGVDAPTEPWNVTAPVSGVVLKVLQESETVVQSGMPLMEIGDPRDLEIVTDVLSTDAVEIRPGADVTIEHWGGPGALSGRVRRVEPAAFTKVSTLGVEEQRVNVLIDVLAPPQQWAGLGDGFQVDTRITVFTQDDIEIIPAGALFRRGDSWSVYVADNGRAQPRTIELIRRSRGFAAVRKGLAQGERVIVYPSDQVSPGVRVSLK
ncbi:HlyD family efflux transporter periplasmic adaptor subunit [Bradyrhizobium sediminis]|uniref:HlyD family efflux transporter periplasmic adaptor subunit n=1 Tax=Bradyrhizobium sediminis TaxID=2840469 RepID=A0A975RN73_9BRAD|nr:HlyD family efflux transporter periplasmic adaptor subunit [Bradyrhizobium sediminis]QWG14412.1 HlyD family efflux transporter periplasmic adaptor subunit [Bradyrhizobium sediminis]